MAAHCLHGFLLCLLDPRSSLAFNPLIPFQQSVQKVVAFSRGLASKDEGPKKNGCLTHDHSSLDNDTLNLSSTSISSLGLLDLENIDIAVGFAI